MAIMPVAIFDQWDCETQDEFHEWLFTNGGGERRRLALPYGYSPGNSGPRRRPSLCDVGAYLRSSGATRTIAPPRRIITALQQAQEAEPPL